MLKLPQTCMPDSVKRLLEVYEVVEQTAQMLLVFLFDDSTLEDLFYCAPAWSKTCFFFFCRRFPSSLGLESVEETWEQ